MRGVGEKYWVVRTCEEHRDSWIYLLGCTDSPPALWPCPVVVASCPFTSWAVLALLPAIPPVAVLFEAVDSLIGLLCLCTRICPSQRGTFPKHTSSNTHKVCRCSQGQGHLQHGKSQNVNPPCSGRRPKHGGSNTPFGLPMQPGPGASLARQKPKRKPLV